MCHTESQPPTPGSFARTLFSREVVAARYLGDTTDDELVIANYEQNPAHEGYGGWPEYKNGTVESERSIKEHEYTGRRADSMVRRELVFDDRTVGAFVTDYAGDMPSKRQAHSQMAVWSFCDAVGIHVPQHHWFPDDEIVVVEEVGGADETIVDPVSLDTRVANHVSASAVLDYICIQLLGGTADLRPSNFKIGEEGQVYIFDFDKSDHRFESILALHTACGKAMQTVDVLNEVRDEELSITRDRICSRVHEIATAIHTSQHFERILRTVGLYDDLFEDETCESFANFFRNNITVFSRGEG